MNDKKGDMSSRFLCSAVSGCGPVTLNFPQTEEMLSKSPHLNVQKSACYNPLLEGFYFTEYTIAEARLKLIPFRLLVKRKSFQYISAYIHANSSYTAQEQN